jgi:hypothetical protein
MLDSKSGLQMSINSDHYVKLTKLFWELKENRMYDNRFSWKKVKDNLQRKTANISRQTL